jgi:hypothetical protein
VKRITHRQKAPFDSLRKAAEAKPDAPDQH